MFFDPVNYFYLCLIVVSLSLLVLYRLERSRIGLTFHAIHWQDKLAESVGVDTRAYRTSRIRHRLVLRGSGRRPARALPRYGEPEPVRRGGDGLNVLVWVIVGGTATIYGPILGVVVLTVVNEVILRELGVDQARPLIYGAILVAVHPVPARRTREPGAEVETLVHA